ncbi:MAG: FAD-dependent thymidylate synthase [SAR202 cluster bacterium]|nr:FAD-dependent thymidylate synthase [SAR202 cluster bacterium]
MKTKLISVTPEAENVIGYCARVSNPKNQDNPDVSKLLGYCIKHGHWSIFEMANMVVEIETTRGIAAQILRHRSFSFQEFSQRYAKAQGFEDVKPRRQDTKNRQNSIDDIEDGIIDWFNGAVKEVEELSNYYYETALSLGIAKESARFLLPLNTKTRMYMNGTVRSWIHYIQLRTDPSTQREHRDIAESIKSLFIDNFPNTSEALNWKNG